MTLVAIIGGSGLTQLKNLEITRREVMRTPYGEPSAPLIYGQISGKQAVFLPRHGHGHTIPPHAVNYRANIWAIKETGATHVIAVNAVGAITRSLVPGSLVFPDQIIDYTYGREHTFFGNEKKPVTHVDFTFPYCKELRLALSVAAREAGLEAADRGTYATTQGPRFETIAEIDRMDRDGADIVGMTGMPETGLARELGLCYASIAVVANPAAGRADGEISLPEIEETLAVGMKKVRTLLEHVIPKLS
ncbi:MAG: S-methyl-5'-thioinosine phosphorylase [Acidiferrobacterales bacterium]